MAVISQSGIRNRGNCLHTNSHLSQMTDFSRFRIRNLQNLIPFFIYRKKGINYCFHMKAFLSQMADFSQLGIRNRGKLIPFFKISKKGIKQVLYEHNPMVQKRRINKSLNVVLLNTTYVLLYRYFIAPSTYVPQSRLYGT